MQSELRFVNCMSLNSDEKCPPYQNGRFLRVILTQTGSILELLDDASDSFVSSGFISSGFVTRFFCLKGLLSQEGLWGL